MSFEKLRTGHASSKIVKAINGLIDAVGAGGGGLVLGSTGSTAAAGNHVHTATQVTATAVAGGTATTVQGILAELTARIADLETP